MIDPKTSEALQQKAKAVGEAVDALLRAVRAAAEFYATLLRSIDVQAIAAILDQDTPPRVRHLALRGKSTRTRKKNINRAIREYRKRGPKV